MVSLVGCKYILYWRIFNKYLFTISETNLLFLLKQQLAQIETSFCPVGKWNGEDENNKRNNSNNSNNNDRMYFILFNTNSPISN